MPNVLIGDLKRLTTVMAGQDPTNVNITGGSITADLNTNTGSMGTFTATGASSVTVANTTVTANSVIVFTPKTPAGTVSPNALNVKTITPGTGFTVAGTASDTSVYNYAILN